MLRARPTLDGVFLCFVCLLSLEPQADAEICTQDIIVRVESLIRLAPELSWLDSRLYTPTLRDYMKCPSSTIRCFAEEAEVLTDEWETIVKRIRRFKLSILLKELATYFNETESVCLRCELLTEQNAENFLNNLLSTLQYINTQHC
ncbi:hypothetical protein INR49_027245 [Caranx melampygus]|nr:hypothetical protein INR49_027245 [Caranx melampygus]